MLLCFIGFSIINFVSGGTELQNFVCETANHSRFLSVFTENSTTTENYLNTQLFYDTFTFWGYSNCEPQTDNLIAQGSSNRFLYLDGPIFRVGLDIHVTRQNLVNSVERTYHCSASPKPLAVYSAFGGFVTCTWNQRNEQMNMMEVSIKVTDDRSHTCTCVWLVQDANFVCVNSTTVTNETKIEQIHWNNVSDQKPPTEIVVEEGFNLKLAFKYELPVNESTVNVTWSQTVKTLYDDVRAVSSIKKYEIVNQASKALNNTLLLGRAKVTDNGLYEATVMYEHKPVVKELFKVTVNSKTVHVRFFVVDPDHPQADVNPKFLTFGKKYNFACVAEAYPFPVVAMYWQPCPGRSGSCQSSIDVQYVSGNNSYWRRNGTFETAIYFQSEATVSGNFICSANNTSESVHSVVVTDIPNAQNNGGTHLEIVDKNRQDIVDGDESLMIRLSVQKQYTSVLCKYGRDCSVEDLETATNNCRLLVRAFASSVSEEHLQFASNWKQYLDSQPLVANVTFDDGGIFLNSLNIIFENIQPNYTGILICKAMDFGDTVGISHLNINVKNASAPMFNPEPVVDANGYNKSSNFTITCKGYGMPMPKVQWYRNGDPVGPEGEILSIVNFDTGREDKLVYECRLTNRVGQVNAPVTLLQAKEIFQEKNFMDDLERLSRIIYITMTAITVILLTVTPMSFQRRTARKVELEDLQKKVMAQRTKREEDQYEEETCLDPNKPITQQMDHLPYDTRFEYSRDLIDIEAMIGCGFSGNVYKGFVTQPGGKRKAVAIKTPKDERNVEQMKASLHEMQFLLHIGRHENVLRLVGACTNRIADGELFVLVEFCEFGSLDDFLYNCRSSFVDELLSREDMMADDDLEFLHQESFQSTDDCPRVTTKDLLSYSFQAAKGMEYLANRGVIHRDLALRNLLQTKDRIIKIADFGLSRQEGYYLKNSHAQLPYKWMALESILNRKYSTKSDVWSFGIVLWEMFSLAQEPYSGMTVDQSFIAWLKSGHRLSRPQYAPENMHNLMLECWSVKPDDRPTFAECQIKIKRMSEDLFPDSISILENHYVTIPLIITSIASESYKPVLTEISSDSDYGGSTNMSLDSVDTRKNSEHAPPSPNLSVENTMYMRCM